MLLELFKYLKKYIREKFTNIEKYLYQQKEFKMQNVGHILQLEIENYASPGVDNTNDFYSTVTTPYEIAAPSASTVTCIPAESRGGNEGLFIYTISFVQGIDFVTNPCLIVTLPPVSLKSPYTGRWRKDLFHHIICRAEMSICNSTIISFDRDWLDIWSELDISNKNLYKMGIGQSSNEYLKDIPEKTIIAPQPWFYRERPFFMRKNISISHEYYFDLDLKNLIEIIDQEGNIIETTSSCFDCHPSDLHIPTPTFAIRIIGISDAERNARNNNFLENPNAGIVFFDNVVHQTINVEHSQKEISVPLQFNSPVREIYWRQNGEFIKQVGIRYEKIKWRNTLLPNEYYIYAEPWFKNSGKGKIAAMYFGNKSRSFPSGDVGVSFAPGLGSEIVFKIGNIKFLPHGVIDLYIVIQQAQKIQI